MLIMMMADDIKHFYRKKYKTNYYLPNTATTCS